MDLKYLDIIISRANLVFDMLLIFMGQYRWLYMLASKSFTYTSKHVNNSAVRNFLIASTLNFNFNHTL